MNSAANYGGILAHPSAVLNKNHPSGLLEKGPRCGKTTVIPVSEPTKAGGFDKIHFMIFAFVFAFDFDSRKGAPRPSPERMKWMYMAASVSSPAGSENVRAKGQRQSQNGFRLSPE